MDAAAEGGAPAQCEVVFTICGWPRDHLIALLPPLMSAAAPEKLKSY
jgi:hypothetical protein